MNEPVATRRTMEEIQAGLLDLLVGADRQFTITAALSIASTSAVLEGVSKIELQQRLIRLYDKRLAEGLQWRSFQ